MFRASASHLECVGMSRFDSGFVECCLCRLTGVETCLLGLEVVMLMKSQKGTRNLVESLIYILALDWKQ